MARIEAEGAGALLAELDPETADRIDRANPMRIQRAWEVLQGTGQGLAHWQEATPPPTLPLDDAQAFVLSSDKEWLNARIERRFDMMVEAGMMDEVARNRPTWSPALPSAKAIGAAELMALHDGDMTFAAAREAVIIQTRQYAKRQRSWFRSRMKAWEWIDLSG